MDIEKMSNRLLLLTCRYFSDVRVEENDCIVDGSWRNFIKVQKLKINKQIK